MALALVTGGTSGIGYAFAQAYALRGYDIVLVARDTERGERICHDFTDRFGVSAEFLTADLAKAEDVAKVTELIESTNRRVDIVVNCAGFGLHGGMMKRTNEEAYERAISVMCVAVMKISAAAARAMTARGYGQIINISSASSWIMQGNYSAVKSWVLRYTQGLAVELDGTGVNAMAVCPGWVRTEFHSRAGISTRLPSFVWVPLDLLVRQAIRDAREGKMVSVPTLRWRFLLFLSRLAPMKLIAWISKKLVKSRKSDG